MAALSAFQRELRKFQYANNLTKNGVWRVLKHAAGRATIYRLLSDKEDRSCKKTRQKIREAIQQYNEKKKDESGEPGAFQDFAVAVDRVRKSKNKILASSWRLRMLDAALRAAYELFKDKEEWHAAITSMCYPDEREHNLCLICSKDVLVSRMTLFIPGKGPLVIIVTKLQSNGKSEEFLRFPPTPAGLKKALIAVMADGQEESAAVAALKFKHSLQAAAREMSRQTDLINPAA